MKRLTFMCIIFSAFFLEAIVPEAPAQTRREVAVSRKKNRRVKRKIRRKVRRRVTRRAHVRYRTLPRYGVHVTVRPNARAIRYREVTYLFSEGVFYREVSTSQFLVVRPPRGIRVLTLPARAIAVAVSNKRYHYYYGNFYLAQGNEYEVTESPIGAVVDAIPEGYEVVTVDDQEYYKWEDTYFQEVETNEFEEGIGYEVVAI